MSSGAKEAPGAEIWLIDGYNVLHAAILRGGDRQGFWSAAMRARVVERVADFEAGAGELFVVFDGREPARESPRAAPAHLHVVFAASADDWIVRRVRAAAQPDRITVVTADRKVRDRVRHRGARVLAPRAFLARCGGEATEPGAERTRRARPDPS